MKRAISLLLSAASVLAAGDVLLVGHKWADSAGFYDTETGKQLAVVPAGVKPHEFALTPDRSVAYLTNYGVDRYTETSPGGNTLTILDLRRRQKAGEIDLGTFHRPHGIEMGPSGRLYITCDFPPSLIVVDPKERKIVESYELGESLPHMLVLTHDEKAAYTANAGAGSVTLVRFGARKPEARIPVGGVPMGLALSRDGTRLYVATRTANTIAVIDTATNRVVGKIEIAGNPARLALTPDGKHLLASLIEAGDVAVIDLANQRVAHRFHAGANVEGIMVDPSGRFGYASAQGDNTVVKFSLRDWKEVLRIRTESRPDPLAVLPGF